MWLFIKFFKKDIDLGQIKSFDHLLKILNIQENDFDFDKFTEIVNSKSPLFKKLIKESYLPEITSKQTFNFVLSELKAASKGYGYLIENSYSSFSMQSIKIISKNICNIKVLYFRDYIKQMVRSNNDFLTLNLCR